MKMLTVAVDEKFAKAIDKRIKQTGYYTSRSEFLKDAIREKLERTEQEKEESLKFIRQQFKEMAMIAKARGWDGSPLTKEEKDKIARDFAKKKGFKIKQ